MKIIEQSIVFEEDINGEEVIRKIERAAKTCYRAEHRVGSYADACAFVASLIKRGHESTIEHVSISARVITNRGVSHEWVRHRVGCSYSQESTRYCNYGGEKFGNEITVIWPWFLGPFQAALESWVATDPHFIWHHAMEHCEKYYLQLLQAGCKPEEARGVLPNDLKTEFVTTMTLRAWRHFIRMRASAKAHPQIRDLAVQALAHFSDTIPAVFDDLKGEA